jgi:hypothetical protein
MKNLTSLLLIVPLFSILMVQTVRGQTEEEFRQEFEQYALTHSESEWQAYALNRFAQMTTDVILQEAAWTLIERSFTTGPCLSVRQQICDHDFEQRMLEITATTTAAGAVCAFTAAGNPYVFAVCISAVAVQHYARLAAAQNAHRACYLRARLDCLPPPSPTPSPNHCSILAPEREGINAGERSATRDIVPLLADCSLYEDPCLCPPRSPIMIDVAGNGFDLTNVADGVMFNITGFGREPLGWTQANSDDALLALDLNANGLIDNGLELFGNFSAQPEPTDGAERNGFEALAVFDLNGDGRIDSEDTVYSELRLWQDKNHNGISESGELHPVDKLGLKTLFLSYSRSKRVDKHGNEFRYRARVNDFRDRQLGRSAWDVFLVSSRRRVTTGGGLMIWPRQ